MLIDTSWASVWHDHGNTVLFALLRVHHLGCSVLMSACESTAEIDGRERLTSLPFHSILWHEDRESHLAVVHSAPVLNRLNKATTAFHSADNLNVFSRTWLLMLIDGHNTAKTAASVHYIG